MKKDKNTSDPLVPETLEDIAEEENFHGDDLTQGHQPGQAAGVILNGIFFTLAIAALALWGETSAFRTAAITFVAIVLEAVPFVLVGSIAGGLVEEFVSRERLSRIFPQGKAGVLLAAILGMAMPVCECAVVPIVRRLLSKGVPPGAAVTYLLAGPIVNPVVFLSTGVAYSMNWSVALLRLALGYTIGAAVGLLVNTVFGSDPRKITLSGNEGRCLPNISCSCHHEHEAPLHDCPRNLQGRLWTALGHGADDFLEAGKYFIMGAFLAAVINTVLPRPVIADFVHSPASGIGSAMMLAVGLNLCSDADAFIAVSMRSVWALSAQMAFMLLGPMLDIKLLFMYRSVFRGRFMIFMTVAILTSVLCVATALHFFGGGHRG
ncbi:permease [Syntrophorhabdus aromaticivorans]|uniref:permease n=1 Tax=Syntrophorhabdus aromaticivorans TaxID=328301 RepID=UPI0004070490|nr:permease [Syntrophorhabdus aromaticivorans]